MKTLLISLFVTLLFVGCTWGRPGAKRDELIPHKQVRPIASRPPGHVTLVMADRGKSLFRISNDSAKTIHLTTLFRPSSGIEFTAINTTYEVLRDGTWKRLPYAIDGVVWDHPLRPRKSLTTFIDLSHFGIDLSDSEIGNVSRGDLVRVWLDNFPSKPFRW